MSDNTINIKLVAQKLEQVPVPDMMDAIWSSIESQLDGDMPGNDGGHTPPPAPTIGRRVVIVAFVVAVITLLILYKPRKKETGEIQPVMLPAKEMTIIPAQPQAPGVSKTVSTKPVQKPSLIIVQPATDSVNVTPTIVLPLPAILFDSTQANNRPAPDSILLLPPVTNPANNSLRKKKGAQGISDKDYRIVPKKDSTH